MFGNISTRFSRKVTIVSFVMAVFVMYIHAKNLAYYDLGNADGTLIYVLNQILSETFGRVGVPFFFLQSGYWMFRYDIYETKSDVLKRKLKKKVTSLGIPYLIWNTLGLLFFLTVPYFLGMLFTKYEGQVVGITWRNIFEGVFLHKYYLPFWFMQDLIVLTAFSTILVLLLRNKYVTYVTITILLILSIFGINTPVCQTSSILLFMMGGALSVYHREYWENPNSNRFETAFYILLFLIGAVIRWLSIPYLSTFFVVLSPILFWKSFELLGQMKVFDYEPLWFCKQSFFIYCAHIFPVQALNSLLSRVSSNMAWVSFSYVVNPLIILLLLYVAARILAQRFPKVYKLLCGNRV